MRAEEQRRGAFEDAWYLMLTGELPTAEQRAEFARQTAVLRELPDGMAELLPLIARRSAPGSLAALRTAVSLAAQAIDCRPWTDQDGELTRAQAARIAAMMPTLAAQLNREFIAKGLLGYDGTDWKDRIKLEYTDALTSIGGQQDEMVGECRWVVKALRQQAGILMATEPKMAPIAAEIRARTQKMLRGGAAYEGARH